MTPELRQQAARAFWLDEEATDDQVQAVLIIAQQKKFRPKFVLGLDTDRKARHLATLGSLPDAIAARVLIVYHLAEQRSMMGTFLDALGITARGRTDQGRRRQARSGEARAAAAQIAQQFPAEHVSLYLNTLLCQDPGDLGSVGGAAAEARVS